MDNLKDSYCGFSEDCTLKMIDSTSSGIENLKLSEDPKELKAQTCWQSKTKTLSSEPSLPLADGPKVNPYPLPYEEYHLKFNSRKKLDHKRHLKSDPVLDKKLKLEFEQHRLSFLYKKMLKQREKLPAYKVCDQIIDLINHNQVVVISGETGCGKTTQVAQYILDDKILHNQGSTCHVVCTQPRRISAISIAERVAKERGELLKQHGSVGYQIRLECIRPRNQGSILFCTTGIILQYLQEDHLLSEISHLIVDEIHERSINSDFLLIVIKEILPRRPDLKVILMSATINPEIFSKYYGDCPMMTIPGWTFPVTEFALEDILEDTGYVADVDSNFTPSLGTANKSYITKLDFLDFLTQYYPHLCNRYSPTTLASLEKLMNSDKIDYELIRHLVRHIILNMEVGAILIFLPGWEEIRTMHEKFVSDDLIYFNCILIPLHSLMPTVNQKEIFDIPPNGERKIIIATNIAESSITINDVVFVIDTGLMKEMTYDITCKIKTLKVEWVSFASATQRKGRAGRVQPGYFFYLYTRMQMNKLIEYQLPELMRMQLEELCLLVKILNLGKIVPFLEKALESPTTEAVQLAIKNLMDLKALDDDEKLTHLGYYLAQMPVEPQIGKMIVYAAIFSCLDPLLTVAASLSFKNPFVIPMNKRKEAQECRLLLSQESKSDHITTINALEGWEIARSHRNRNYCHDHFLSSQTISMLIDMKKRFAELLFQLKFIRSRNVKDKESNQNSSNRHIIKAVLCAGLYPNIAKATIQHIHRGGNIRCIKTKEGEEADIHPKSVNFREKYFESSLLTYYEKVKSNKIYIHDSTMISQYSLFLFGTDFKDEENGITIDDWLSFNVSSDDVSQVKKLRLELQDLLERKMSHPGPTNWHISTAEGQFLHSVNELLAKENRYCY